MAKADADTFAEVLQVEITGTEQADGGEEGTLMTMEKRASEVMLVSPLRVKSSANLEFLAGGSSITYQHGYETTRKGKCQWLQLSTSSWVFLALALTQG